jgi:hypothetical protein
MRLTHDKEECGIETGMDRYAQHPQPIPHSFQQKIEQSYEEERKLSDWTEKRE